MCKVECSVEAGILLTPALSVAASTGVLTTFRCHRICWKTNLRHWGLCNQITQGSPVTLRTHREWPHVTDWLDCTDLFTQLLTTLIITTRCQASSPNPWQQRQQFSLFATHTSNYDRISKKSNRLSFLQSQALQNILKIPNFLAMLPSDKPKNTTTA